MALVAMGLPVDAIDLREPSVAGMVKGLTRLTTLDMTRRGDHQIVYRVTNHGPRRVRLSNLLPGFTYLILVEAERGAVPHWDWDKAMLWHQRRNDDGSYFEERPILSAEFGCLDIIHATCVATDRVLCSYSIGHR